MQPSDICMWSDDDDGTFFTDCGNAFVLNEGIPSDHKMKFCCYCGKPLVENIRFSEAHYDAAE